MHELRSAVVLVTGVMASGKSTVAQLLAERLPGSVHLRGDGFRQMIVSGRCRSASLKTSGSSLLSPTTHNPQQTETKRRPSARPPNWYGNRLMW